MCPRSSSDLEKPVCVGQGLQQGGTVILLLKNAPGKRCCSRAGLHTTAFLSWGVEAAGLPLISALQGRVELCRVLSQLLLWLSLSRCRLRMPQILWYGTAGTPTHSWDWVLPEARLCAPSFALFSLSMHENTPQRSIILPLSLPNVLRQIF